MLHVQTRSTYNMAKNVSCLLERVIQESVLCSHDAQQGHSMHAESVNGKNTLDYSLVLGICSDILFILACGL